MKRKQFLNRLLKISQLNQSLNPLKDIPLVFCKQSKMVQREDKRDSLSIKPSKRAQPQQPVTPREVLIINQDLTTKKLFAARELGSPHSKTSSRRLRTTPAFCSLEDEVDRLEKQDVRKFSYVSVELKQNSQNFICAKEPPLQTSPVKRFEIRDLTIKEGSILLKTRDSANRKQSLTEPTASVEKEVKTSRGLMEGSQSKRAESIKKYQSVNQAQVSREQKQQKINLRRQINRNYTKPFQPPPKITAKSYIIYELLENGSTGRVVVSFNSKNTQEVASLTKIMTCILVLELCQQCGLDRYAEEVTIGKFESSIGGTTASLQAGEVYTVHQLLYGLMLPSGNDASLALAVWGGGHLLDRQRQLEQKLSQINDRRKDDDTLRFKSSTSCLSTNSPDEYKGSTKGENVMRFIQEMNRKAAQFGMSKTHYANSHGLVNPNNRSSAFDIAILCQYAMQNESFRAIVSSPQYQGTARIETALNKTQKRPASALDSSDSQSEEDMYASPPQRHTVNKKPSLPVRSLPKQTERKTVAIEWQNTHKLLHLRPKEYIGIKTGFTTAAGPCLSSCVRAEGREFIIVVLGCAKMSLRFKQTDILKKWLFRHEGLKKGKKLTTKDEQNEECQRQEGVQESKANSILKQLNAEQEIED